MAHTDIKLGFPWQKKTAIISDDGFSGINSWVKFDVFTYAVSCQILTCRNYVSSWYCQVSDKKKAEII